MFALSLGACADDSADDSESQRDHEFSPNDPTPEHAAELPPVVPGPDVAQAIRYESVSGEPGVVVAPPTICELAYAFDGGAGVYTAQAITGVTETWEDVEGPQEAPALWVFFERTGVAGAVSDERVVLRFNAGPYGDGLFLEPALSLTVGQQVLLLYSGPRAYLQGFPTTAAHGLFDVSTGQPVGAGGTFDLSVEEFLERLEAAAEAVGELRPDDVSQAPPFEWAAVCPADTLVTPTALETEAGVP